MLSFWRLLKIGCETSNIAPVVSYQTFMPDTLERGFKSNPDTRAEQRSGLSVMVIMVTTV